VSFALTALSLANKPLGYARTLWVAWAFGTSPGMDAFHLASGIVAFFAGSIGSTLENTVLPEILRLKDESGGNDASRSAMAMVSSFMLLLTALLVSAMIIAPGMFIKFFARGFDQERVIMGARMMLWLTPLAAVSMYRPILDIWATFTERYTLLSLVSTVFNFVAIPSLILSAPLIGVYSTAFSVSAGHLVLFVMFLLFMRGIPFAWRPSAALKDSAFRICKNSACLTAIIAASSLYVIVDKYFASNLPSGSVAAISYAAMTIGFMTSIAGVSMNFFLSKITKIAASDPLKAKHAMETSIALSLAYLFPVSAFITASSDAVVSVIFGWGRFDARSVSMTSTCLASYCLGFSFSIASIMMYRHALAVQKLKAVVVMSYISVALNAFLDWALVGRFGLLGLALATSAASILVFAMHYRVIIQSSLTRYLIKIKFFEQMILTIVIALCARLALRFGSAANLAAAAVLFVLYLYAAERFSLMPEVPAHWRPSKLAKFLFSAARSYIHE
jgi:putative peptidoglycan lipid II flippase